MPGFINAVNTNIAVIEPMQELYYLAFPLGFFISFLIYWVLNTINPPRGLDETDELDHFCTFTQEEAKKLGLQASSSHGSEIESVEVNIAGEDKGEKGNSFY